MQFGRWTLKRCRYGWMLFDGPYIGKCFELYGQYSESEVSLMRQFLRDGSTVIDVGANIGDLTVPLARAVGLNRQSLCHRVQPRNFQCALRESRPQFVAEYQTDKRLRGSQRRSGSPI